jgi:lipoate-protein ligase A
VTGRLILDGARNGAYNMAADLFCADLANQTGRPLLRFYAWDTATLSLGYHQKLSPHQVERFLEREVPIVRRPTGGRAVLHDRELTYCLCVPDGHPVYRHERSGMLKEIGSVFVNAAEQLGLNAQLARTGSRNHPSPGSHKGGSPLCFDSISRWEVQLNGRKWIGSAQRFLPGVLLQHGSILMRRSDLDLSELLDLSVDADVTGTMAFAQEESSVSESELRQEIFREFSRRWELDWEVRSVNDEESEEIENRKDMWCITVNQIPEVS